VRLAKTERVKKVKTTFMQDVLSGRADENDVWKYVKRWNKTANGVVTLSSFLGLTLSELQQWEKDSSRLKHFIDSRKISD
jgi:hypothetical protein